MAAAGPFTDRFVHTNANLRALANVLDLSIINLVSLDSLSSAPEMFQTLHALVRARDWMCVNMPILQGLSVLTRTVQEVRPFLPPLEAAVMPNPVLHGNASILHTLAHIRFQGSEILNAWKVLKFRKGALERQSKKVGGLLYDEIGRTLDGTMALPEFQARIPHYIAELDILLDSRIVF
ncbi:hypothetical protein ACQJBY_025982 [Aegilops geniculata]